MALRSSFTVAKCLGSLRTLRVCPRVCKGEGAGGRNHHLCPIWPFRVSDFDQGTFTFHFHALEKEMATHSRVLAWRIPGMGEPGGLPSMGSHRVGHN